MNSWHRHFIPAFAFCLAAAAAAYFIGGWGAVATVGFLTVLETSLSFDNAVVNAGILGAWNEVWRRRFLTWGMFIAVFGMRLVFPVIVVAVAGHVGPFRAVDLALNDPAEYGRVLTAAHHQIAGFGGAFLMMVFLNFFVARHKTEHWLVVIERPLTRLGKMEAVEAVLTLLAVLAAAATIHEPVRSGQFVVAGVWGVVVFTLTRGITALLGGGEAQERHVVRQGAAGFLYVELLDASFSFDGVAGAFAMTHNLFIITLGLGAGAMFVRSFTLLLVQHGTLDAYRYLEHGAFWAVGALAGIMLGGVDLHVPEALTGLVGAALIILALASSIRANRINP
jgi:hypothetical protein